MFGADTEQKSIISWFWDMPIEFIDKVVLSKSKRVVMIDPTSPSGEWWLRFTSMLNIEDIFTQMSTFMPHGSYSIPYDARKKTLLIRFNATWGRYPPGYAVREFMRRLRFAGFTVVAQKRQRRALMNALELRPESRKVPRYKTPPSPEVTEPRSISEAYRTLGMPSGTPLATLRQVGKHILASSHPDAFPESQRKYMQEMFKKKSVALTYLLRELAKMEQETEIEGYGFGILTLRR